MVSASTTITHPESTKVVVADLSHAKNSNPIPRVDRSLQVLFEDASLNNCYDNLRAADESGDSFLTPEEYLKFIYIHSNGVVTPDLSPDFSSLDWLLISIFYHAEWESGTNIDIRQENPDAFTSTVIYVCGAVDARVEDMPAPPTGSVAQEVDTPAPTSRLSPTQAPTTAAPTTPRPTSSPQAVTNSTVVDKPDQEVVRSSVPPGSDNNDNEGIGIGLLAALVALLGVSMIVLAALIHRKRQQQRNSANHLGESSSPPRVANNNLVDDNNENGDLLKPRAIPSGAAGGGAKVMAAPFPAKNDAGIGP
ncbi:hypothetical protein ACA910_010561 [Epithemia clementina (nom. ined.)]